MMLFLSGVWMRCGWHAVVSDFLFWKLFIACLVRITLHTLSPPLWIRRCVLTHWGRVTHQCVGNLTIIGSDNGLSPGRRQAITWTNVGILLIRPLATNFSERLIEIHTFSFKKIHLKMWSGKWRPFFLCLNVLRQLSWGPCLPHTVQRFVSDMNGKMFVQTSLFWKLFVAYFTVIWFLSGMDAKMCVKSFLSWKTFIA